MEKKRKFACETGKHQEMPDIQKMISNISVEGSVDFGFVSKETCHTIITWYKQEFQFLERNLRTSILEQGMLHGYMDDDEVVQIVKRLSVAERQEVGGYIGQALRPEVFIRSFQECWPDFSKDQQDGYVHEFTECTPHLGYIVAPFVDLTKKTPVPNKDGYILNESWLGKYGEYIDSGVKIIASLTHYIVDHPEVYEKEKSVVDALSKGQLVNRYESVLGKRSTWITDNLNGYLSEKHFAVLPHVEMLLQCGIPSKELKKMVEGIVSVANSKCHDHFLLPKEQKKMEQVSDVIRAHQFRIAQDHQYGIEDASVKDAQRVRSALNCLAENRAAEFVAEHVQKSSELLGMNPFGQIKNLVHELPILKHLDKLGLSAKECASLFAQSYGILYVYSLSDVRAILKKGSEMYGNVFESYVVDSVIRDVEREGCLTIGRDADISMIISLFSQEENRKKFTAAITKRVPFVWFEDIDFALKNGYVKPDVLTGIIHAHPEQFLVHLPKLRRDSKKLQQMGENVIDLDVSEGLLKKILDEHPKLFCSFHLQPLIDSLYSEEEKRLFIQKHIRSASFVEVFIRGDVVDKYAGLCAELLQSNKDFFVRFASSRHADYLLDILPPRVVFDLLVRYIDEIDVKYIVSSDVFIQAFIAYPKEVERWVKKWAHDRAHQLPLLSKTLSRVQFKSSKSSVSADVAGLQRQKRELVSGAFAAKQADKEVWLRAIRSVAIKLKKAVRIRSSQSENGDQETCAESFATYVRSLVIQQCRKDPDFACQESVLSLEGVPRERVVDQFTLLKHVRLDPELLLVSDSIHSEASVKQILGSETYGMLVQDFRRYFAFADVSFGQEMQLRRHVQDFKAINPLFGWQNDSELCEDFYTKALAKIASSRFFSWYQNELGSIADEENKNNRGDIDPWLIGQSAAFIALCNRISLLESSKTAQAYAHYLEALPSERRDRIASLLELAARYNLDSFVFEKNDRDCSVLESALLERVGYFANDLFGLTDKKLASDAFDFETLQALMVYFKIGNEKEGAYFKRSFKRFVESVVEGRYKEWRAWGIPELSFEKMKEQALVTMKSEGLLPRKVSSEQYAQWVLDDRVTLESVLEFDVSTIHFAVDKVLRQAVADRHIESETFSSNDFTLKGEYADLVQPMREWTEEQKVIRERLVLLRKTYTAAELVNSDEYRLLEEKYEIIKQALNDYAAEHEMKMLKIEAQRYLLHLKSITSKDLENNILSVDKKKVPLQKVFETMRKAFIAEYPHFVYDVQQIQTNLNDVRDKLYGSARVSKSVLTLTDAVDLKTHVFIGECPVPSCQNFASHEGYNMGLLSYLTDPNVKIVQMYGERKQIVARAVMRLLEDELGNPHIFLERVYSSNMHPKVNESMTAFAKNKANKMGIPFHDENQNGPLVGGAKVDLFSRGTRGVAVYSDAGGGLRERGVYCISAD